MHSDRLRLDDSSFCLRFEKKSSLLFSKSPICCKTVTANRWYDLSSPVEEYVEFDVRDLPSALSTSSFGAQVGTSYFSDRKNDASHLRVKTVSGQQSSV